MKNKIPRHLAIIIDGNRRWARQKGLSSFDGHKKGLDNVFKIGDYCLEKGIKVLTLYCFSVENWRRTKKEVGYLMKLFLTALNKENIEKFNKNNIRLQIIGQKEKLPKLLRSKIKIAERLTKNNKGGVVNLAISYGGRPEIVEAVKNIVREKILSSKITENLISDNLWTAGLPDPDLIIRTGGEKRLSNFLTWQSVYAELCFIDKFWPEFTKEDLDRALEDYSNRNRRFGK